MIHLSALHCVAQTKGNEMIYTLIAVWILTGTHQSSQSSVVAEFNDFKSCKAAADALYKQRPANLMVCAAKGVKK